MVYTDRTDLANLTYPGFDPRQLYAQDWIRLEKTIYEHASLVFTRSQYIIRSLREDYHCPPEKPVCVYAGANTLEQAEPIDPARYAAKNILFVGVNWEIKGGPDLLAAFRLVLEKEPAATMTIIGSAPKTDLPQVQVIGTVPVAELPAYYRRAAIFCLPTRFEAFGVAYIEAMRFGLPIIATAIGAIPDFVIPGENGFLVTPGDVAGLADALLALLADPEKCRAYGERGREISDQRYTWENTGRLIRGRVLDYLSGPPALNEG